MKKTISVISASIVILLGISGIIRYLFYTKHIMGEIGNSIVCILTPYRLNLIIISSFICGILLVFGLSMLFYNLGFVKFTEPYGEGLLNKKNNRKNSYQKF